ncbi:hypothetical protein L3i20_v213260 [Paenibacillus sp. L3-i20]|nr:hypothetical protein L3i20_v213260 [Paenibacillus sp. L3-i20]
MRPAKGSGEDADAWLRRLRSEPGIEYVHPNRSVSILSQNPVEVVPESSQVPTEETDGGSSKVSSHESPSELFVPPSAKSAASTDIKLSLASKAPKETAKAPKETAKAPKEAAQTKAKAVTANDPELAKQTHLVQIGALKAWSTVREQKDLTIALIDTGVDLDHPDLKDNLVQGANLVNPKKTADDDNGHGTSVAGVIAAAGNNNIGGSGILWNAKIMPIKALDKWGDGTELDLGEAILYAIKRGAKIVVMSVGLHRHSPYMQDIVNYAENKGVLLVAATGNDGVKSGTKAAVKFPAAYPTVLAVGGVQPNNRPDRRSNPGSELDILAPWNVYTTAMGGTYKKEEGTSMAAPQVAAAAALIMAKQPKLKPYQVRELLRQTAKDIGAKGADNTSGYGVLQLDKAVSTALSMDAHEPNERSQVAKPISLFSEITATLATNSDKDWFVVDVPSDGKLTLNYKGFPTSGSMTPVVQISHYDGSEPAQLEDIKLASKVVELTVRKGKQLIGIEFSSPNVGQQWTYSLTNSFAILPDAYEPNDRFNSAVQLDPKSQTIKGTFHQTGDRDWYIVDFPHDGKLELSLDTNSVRIDPGLSLQREGHSLILYDEHGEGMNEQSPVISITPGKYYIRIHNAIALEASPTIGHYTLKMHFTPELDDPNEPNDKSYEALLMSPGTEYRGVMTTASDTDWFQFRVSSQSIVSLSLSGVPSDAELKLEGLDKRMKIIASGNSGTLGNVQTTEQVLQPGLYYVKLTTNKAFYNQYYRLRLQVEELIFGFKDIKEHWAKNDIVSLSKQQIINGVGGYRFAPERSITRAEAVAMIVKAYKPLINQSITKPFTDVSSTHWANGAIQKAVQQGWVKGFPNNTFRPEQSITRAEMAVIIGHAEGVKARFPISRPFTDVAPSEWYSPMLFAMKVDGKLQGIQANRYEPYGVASRAEFTTLLYRYFKD